MPPATRSIRSCVENPEPEVRLRPLRAIVLCAGMFAALFGAVPFASAQQPRPAEYRVKAVYLYNFGRFVEWPAGMAQNESFDICVMGRDPFGGDLDSTLAGEAINGLKLAARRMDESRDAAGCRILFISASESPHIKEILNALQKTPVLTVSDAPGFIEAGGMIQFVLRENKVRFEVNRGPAEKAGLILSSQLLKVATDIRKEP